MRKSKQNTPWWLEEGTEVCPACSHPYVIQTEFRCVACDGPVCGICVGTIEMEIICSSCADEPFVRVEVSRWVENF